MNDVVYGGIFQPRYNQSSLCHRIYRHIAKLYQQECEREALREEIRKIEAAGKTLFLSEEMFLVQEDNNSIGKKIDALQEFFGKCECRIILTMRRAEDALPSYYQEIFHTLPKKFIRSFAAFCGSERAMCYDYYHVCELLRNAGFEDFLLVDFEYLVSGEMDLADLTGVEDFAGRSLNLKNHNVSQFTISDGMRVLPKITLKDYLKKLTSTRHLGDLTPEQMSVFSNVLLRVLNLVPIRCSEKRKLTVPTRVLKYLNTSSIKAKKEFGCVGSNNFKILE